MVVQNLKSSIPISLDKARFDLAAASLFPHVSRKKIKKIIDLGGAYLNKRRIKFAKQEVKKGDEIQLFWDNNVSNDSTSKESNQDTGVQFGSINQISILFDHKDFVIIDKPAGIATQATLTSSKDTIFHALNTLYPEKFPLSSMHMVHRLDKDTSGILIIARNKLAQKEFEKLFLEKKIEKTYEAICFFSPQKKAGIISYPIAKSNHRTNTYEAVMHSRSKVPHAKQAFTKYEVLQNLAHGTCLVKCFPETGRTHQIRVHLMAIGCPILGDKTYAQNIVGHRYGQLALRQMLHASAIEFTYKQERISIICEWSKDYKEVWQTLSNY